MCDVKCQNNKRTTRLEETLIETRLIESFYVPSCSCCKFKKNKTFLRRTHDDRSTRSAHSMHVIINAQRQQKRCIFNFRQDNAENCCTLITIFRSLLMRIIACLNANLFVRFTATIIRNSDQLSSYSTLEFTTAQYLQCSCTVHTLNLGS